MALPPLDDRGLRLKAAFEARRGYWTPWLDGTLRLSPDFFEGFLAFTGAPWSGGPLPPKVKELVYIAVDGAVTHLYQPGLRMHVREALRHGATAAEIMAVLQLASLPGLLTQTTSAPFLLEAMGGADALAMDPDREAQRAGFVEATGHWDDGLDALLRIDAQAFREHAGLVLAAWRNPALDMRTRELLALAVHASCTLLHPPGIRRHLHRALACGATSAQVMEVLQLASVIGIHSCSVAVPMLIEAMSLDQA